MQVYLLVGDNIVGIDDIVGVYQHRLHAEADQCNLQATKAGFGYSFEVHELTLIGDIDGTE